MKKSSIKRISYIALTVIIIYMISNYVDYNSIHKTLMEITINSFAKAGLAYFLIYLLRAIRFKILLKGYEVTTGSFLYISLIHGFYNRILPMRTGEASFVYLSKKKHSINIIDATSAVVLSRIYDLASIIILFLFALTSGYYMHNSYLVLFSIAIFIACEFICIYFNRLLLYIHKSLADKEKFNKFKKITKRFLNREKTEYRISLKDLIILNIVSIFQWMMLYFVFYTVLRDITPDISYLKVVLGSIYSNITNTIPASGIGGFGTMEAGWVMGFSILGMDKILALRTGLVVNMITFFLTVIFGICAICYGKLTDKICAITKKLKKN
jgi:uncharacterized protein (TIRG00374 family)